MIYWGLGELPFLADFDRSILTIPRCVLSIAGALENAQGRDTDVKLLDRQPSMLSVRLPLRLKPLGTPKGMINSALASPYASYLFCVTRTPMGFRPFCGCGSLIYESRVPRGMMLAELWTILLRILAMNRCVPYKSVVQPTDIL